MGKRLKSMDVSIHGTTNTFEFDPPVKVDTDDEGEASLSLLQDAETTEVVLVDDGPQTADVEVEVEVTLSVNLDIEMTDLSEFSVEGEYDIERLILDGDYDISSDIENAVNRGDFSVENTDVERVSVSRVYNEDGDEIDV